MSVMAGASTDRAAGASETDRMELVVHSANFHAGISETRSRKWPGGKKARAGEVHDDVQLRHKARLVLLVSVCFLRVLAWGFKS